MKSNITIDGVLSFVRKYWFQVALVLLVLYFFFKKDMTFQVNIQSPDKTEQPLSGKHKQKLTERALPVPAGNDEMISRLELPFIGGRKAKDTFAELAKIDETTRQAYLKRFAKVAVAEQKKFGIPASIFLATALHQSVAGVRELAKENNNHFALICSSEWQGQCIEDQGRRYRSYQTAWESFRDFSLFAQSHFPDLKGKDYKAWAKGMEKAGFGESESFAKNLISIIEGYGLHEADK